MSIAKDFRFPVSALWQGEQRTRVSAPDVEEIDVAVPRELRGPGGHWSPEDLLVAAVASCFTVTFAAVAKRREIPIHSLNVTATGHVGHRDDGRLGFVAVEVTARIQTDPELVEAAERAVRRAHAGCIVSSALDVPVHVVPLVSAAEPALV
jgi:peroxiredoxin-like protein